MITPPYVTVWSGEVGYTVRRDPLLHGHKALFAETGARGQGTPVWGRISEERQRQCAVQGLCQICGEHLKWHEIDSAHAAPGNVLAEWSNAPFRALGYSLVPLTEIKGKPATHEPLVCPACLPGAMRGCPTLRKLDEQGALVPIAVSECELALQVIGPMHPPPDEISVQLNAALKRAGVHRAIGFVEMLITEGVLLSRAGLHHLAGL